jgi:predicted nucleic acid-binding protein
LTQVFFDTSVLVAGMVEAHPSHERALFWLKKAIAKELGFYVCMHTLAELYAVLTRLPMRPKITTGTAGRLIRDNVETAATIVPLSLADYRSVIRDLSERGIAGGSIYDALIAKAARKSSADRLLTLNPEDFERVWPEGVKVIHVP